MIILDYSSMGITMHKGDTGSVEYQLGGDELESTDRVLWTMKDRNGVVVKQAIITPDDGAFDVTFANSDTDSIAPGDYFYDIRVISNPTYDSGKITDGDAVTTLMNPARVKVMNVIGDV